MPGVLACSDSIPTDTPLSTGSTLSNAAPMLGPRAAGTRDASASTPGQTIYAIDADNNLLRFGASRPAQVTHRMPVTGLAPGERIVGIDFRPSGLNADAVTDVGKLYGVGSTGAVYRIDPATGAAANRFPLTDATAATVSLDNTQIGVGFNPTVDRLRIHSDAEQNAAVNVDNGVTAVNAALAYAPGDPGFGSDPRIVGTGYTNNDNDPATGTELFAIDAARDALVRLPVPADGQLRTIGGLGVDTDVPVGLDIAGSGNTAYASLTAAPSGRSRLYRIDLSSGAAQLVGNISGSAAIVGLAVAP
jgi:hypothetical protein